MARVIDRIRQLVREQRYTISVHANEEMSADDLTASDIEHVILQGRVGRRFAKDPRGKRYEIVGLCVDGRAAGVVCRIVSMTSLRIITAYAIED